jgi:precorrin-2 dehydrogenase / sirohydrochlorin ferrochelatase
MVHRSMNDSEISNISLQEFARKNAKRKIGTVKERKQFLYSLIKDKNIQYLLRSNKLNEAKMTALDLLNNWGKVDKP